jgi:phospholipid transport system substrate-binding protein
MTIAVTVLSLFLTISPGLSRDAFALPAPQAIAFVKDICDRLAAIANSADSERQKRHELKEIIESFVDVDEIARFCLGRFWPIATPEQQTEYMTLFHELLVTKIADHLGEYQGVRVTMGHARPSGNMDIVVTTVARPQAPTMQVEWVVSTASGNPKIIDLLAEGTSLRITQNADFTSYLALNHFDVQELIEGMGHLVAQNRK